MLKAAIIRWCLMVGIIAGVMFWRAETSGGARIGISGTVNL